MSITNELYDLLLTHKDHLDLEHVQAEIGELIIRQGEPADRVWLVAEGGLVVELIHENKSHELATLGPGEILGEMGVFGDLRHTAQARVTKHPTKLLYIKKENFMRALLYDVDLAIALLRVSQLRCQKSNELVALLTSVISCFLDGDSKRLQTTCLSLVENGSEGIAIAALLKNLNLKSKLQ